MTEHVRKGWRHKYGRPIQVREHRPLNRFEPVPVLVIDNTPEALDAIAERLYEAWVADMATCLHSGYDHEPCPRCLAAALAEVFKG